MVLGDDEACKEGGEDDREETSHVDGGWSTGCVFIGWP
jgi:hypothetical protein